MYLMNLKGLLNIPFKWEEEDVPFCQQLPKPTQQEFKDVALLDDNEDALFS